jgi:hypothetical protein
MLLWLGDSIVADIILTSQCLLLLLSLLPFSPQLVVLVVRNLGLPAVEGTSLLFCSYFTLCEQLLSFDQQNIFTLDLAFLKGKLPLFDSILIELPLIGFFLLQVLVFQSEDFRF